MSNRLLKVQDAAKILGVSIKTLHRWEKRGVLIPQRTSGSHRRYSEEQLINFKSLKDEKKLHEIKESRFLSYLSKIYKDPSLNPSFSFSELCLSLGPTRQKIIAGFISFLIVSLIGVSLTRVVFPNSLEKFLNGREMAFMQQGNLSAAVLAEQTVNPDFHFNVSIPSLFREDATVSGTLTAPNILYSVLPGLGISISQGQTPTVSNSGVLSFQNQTGQISLTAGTGISISDLTISNNTQLFKTIKTGGTSFSAGSTTDTLEFAAGSGVSLAADTSSKKVTITASNDYGWVDDGTVVRLSTITDTVGIGTITPSATLDLVGTFQYTDGNQGVNKVLASDASGNATWTALGVAGGITGTGTSGYITKFTGASTAGDSIIYDDGTNIGIGTTAPSNLLYVGASGVDNGVTKLYVTGGTELEGGLFANTIQNRGSNDLTFNIDTAGDFAFTNGNVGIGTTAPSALLSVGSTSQFQVSDAGAVTAVGVDSGAGLLQGTGGLTLTGTANINATGTSATSIGNSTGALTLASGGTSAWTNTSGNLTISTATSGTLALTSAGVLNLTSALASGQTTSSAFNFTSSSDLGAADELLQIGDSAANFMTILGNGNVGIGTTEPSARLHVQDDTNTSSDTNLIRLQSVLDAGGTKAITWNDATNEVGRIGLKYDGVSNTVDFVVEDLFNSGYQTATRALTVKGSGNVGIGTTDPSSYKLNVNGTTYLGGATTLGSTLTLGGTLNANNQLIQNLWAIESRTDTNFALRDKKQGAGELEISTAGASPGYADTARILIGGGVAQGSSYVNFKEPIQVDATANSYIQGNVGIGTTAPATFKLEVAGNIGPEDTNTRDLGSADRYFANAYINNLYTGTAGTVGYWSRTGTVLSPATANDTVAIYTGATNTSGNLLNIAYNAGVTLDGSLIGANIDLNDGYVTPTNQSVTGLKVVLPTTINTNDTGEKTLEGMNLGFGNGTGIQQTGAGTTTYSGVHLLLPALTQSEGAGALTANGVLVDTPSAITTNGTANGVKIAASGVNAGSLNGVLISNITGSGGTETALNIGSGWDNVLSVNSTAVIDGSGVVQVAAGGTNLTSYAIGDIIYASGTTTLSSLVTGGAGNDGKILVIAGGLPTWVSSIGGGICADCVLNDPTVVTTQTITPTTDISSLVVRQTTDGTPTKDIFVVASDDYDGADVGTRYFYVDSSGNVSTGGIASQTLTLTPASDTTALTLVGTNVPTANLQYINSKNTQGTIFNLAYGAAATLNGALIGQAIDLSTNVTATDQSVAGLNITLPVVTNTTSTSTYKGLVIAPPVGGGIEQSGAGTTTFSAIDLTLPALTQTAGTLTANGVLVNTPSAITNSGTANGINIVAFGVGAGTLNGINIGAITAGNAAEKAINIGTGWDFGIYSQTTSPSYFAGSVGIGTTAPLSTLDVRGTIENGLVAWWSMDGGTGTTISDQSINSNTGTLGGDGLGTDLPAWITGKFSKALNFDGSDDYVQVANSASIELLHNPLTVEAWIYRRTNSQDWEGIVVKAKAGDPYDGYSLYSMASGVIRARVGYLNYNLDTTSAIINNAWHHVDLRTDGPNYAIYVDGVKASADGTTGTVTTTGTVLWLGRSISAGEYFDGMIDEVRIYNRALSAREIAEHYRQEAPSLAQGGTVSGDLYVMESGSVGIGTTAPAAKMEIASTSTTGGDFLITNTGVGLSGTVAGITANSVTTGDLLTISGTALTTGSGLVMTGPSSTGVTDHFVKITSDVGASSSLIYGAPDFSGSAVTGYGLNITATDATANANTDYGVYSSLALTGNAAKTGVGLYSLLSTASTTADTLVASDLATSTSGIITTGTRSIYGLRTQPVSTAASTGGTTNVYGVYSKAGGVVGAGGIINSYGLYVANGTMDGTGTSTNTGLYVETPTGAGTNYAAIFAGGNVGIGTTDPQALLSVGSTSQFQVSSAGAVTAVGVNSGAGLLQGALGLTITGAAVSLNDSSNFNTTINTGTSTGTVGIGSANAGALTLASGAASSFTVTNNTLTLQTTGTGTLTMALTSAGALNLSAAAASTWTLPAVANALNIDSNTLTIDASNHYVGIGTTGPGEKLEINGNLKFTSSGTISTGNGNLTLGPTGGNVLIPSATVVFWDGNSAGAGAIRFLNEQYLGWRNAGNTDNLTLGVNSNDAFVFSGGNVGIGTTNPSAKLAVSSGSIVIDNGYNIYLNGIAGGALDTNWYLGKDANHNINIAGAPDGTRAFQVLDAGTSAVRLHVEFSGNVGIGTTGPGALLDVRGSAVFNEDSADADFRVESNGNANALTVDANTNNGFGNISFFSAGSDGGLLFMDNAAFTAGNANFGKFRIANANAMTVPSGGALQATVWLEEPNLTLTDTLTDAATLYIGSAPTEATNNYALWVASGNVRFDGSVGIGTTAPGAKLEVNGTSGAGNSGDFILNLQGGSFTESDLYVLNTRDVNTGVGFAAKVIGVNIQNAVGSANQVYLRSNTGG
ncbi:MAG: LamG-like jellyroll fold domain-containing protein, partial [Patescibacteria group bacterium]